MFHLGTEKVQRQPDSSSEKADGEREIQRTKNKEMDEQMEKNTKWRKLEEVEPAFKIKQSYVKIIRCVFWNNREMTSKGSCLFWFRVLYWAKLIAAAAKWSD